MIYYELLEDGTIGRSTNNIKIAQMNGYYNQNHIVENENDIIYGYNGKRYLKNKVPVKPQEIINKEKMDHYENLIISKIRQKYSIDQELAILRQRDSKPEEFAEYNAYVERCKLEAKTEVANGN